VRIFSGIQPTGRKHLGNYIGAILGYLEGQERGNPSIYCIVDLHATSVAYDPSALPGYVLDTAGMLMASGSPTCTSTPSSAGCSPRSRPSATWSG
jgi:tryptophanyl-tRNA synthetase